MKITNKKAKDLKPSEYNPRQISTKQYKDLKKSIETFGLVDPIVINSCGTIIGGHQRFKILQEMETDNIPCVVLDLSKEKEMELNIRLNKSGGEFDMDLLANFFDVDSLVDWGFKHIDLGINVDKIENDLSNELTEKFKIEIDLISEIEQEKMYNKLTKQGYKCRILTL